MTSFLTQNTGAANAATPARAAIAPRALYEYRGKTRDLTAPTVTEPISLAPSRATPLCASCSSRGEKVVGGWWCSSCESAIS